MTACKQVDLKALARELLTTGKVEVFIGYQAATQPLTAAPLIIHGALSAINETPEEKALLVQIPRLRAPVRGYGATGVAQAERYMGECWLKGSDDRKNDGVSFPGTPGAAVQHPRARASDR